MAQGRLLAGAGCRWLAPPRAEGRYARDLHLFLAHGAPTTLMQCRMRAVIPEVKQAGQRIGGRMDIGDQAIKIRALSARPVPPQRRLAQRCRPVLASTCCIWTISPRRYFWLRACCGSFSGTPAGVGAGGSWRGAVSSRGAGLWCAAGPWRGALGQTAIAPV